MIGQDMPLGIFHLFTVSMIRGENNDIFILFGFLYDFAQFRIDSVHRFFCCFKITRMSYHITIGEINNDKIIRFIHRCTYRFTDFRRTHFRLHIISLDIRTRDQNPAFTYHRLFDAAIKEEGHMGILFCFCRMQLSQPRCADHFGKCVFR